MQLAVPVSRRDATADVLDALMTIGRRMRGRGGDGIVDPGTFWLLRTLVADGPSRPTDLAASVGLDASTVSRHLAQLQRLGLVDRSPDPDDRRVSWVEISQTGRAAVDAAIAHRRTLLERSLHDWSDDELELLHRMTTRIAAGLETGPEGPDRR